MAMFPTVMLFYVLLVAFVVKHAVLRFAEMMEIKIEGLAGCNLWRKMPQLLQRKLCGSMPCHKSAKMIARIFCTWWRMRQNTLQTMWVSIISITLHSLRRVPSMWWSKSRQKSSVNSSEMSILKNSSRERMCNSVLSNHLLPQGHIVLSNLAKKTWQYDLEEEDGADVGKVLIGRDASLFWSSKRAQKFGTHAGAKVSMDLYGNIRMLVGSSCTLYFKEEPVSEIRLLQCCLKNLKKPTFLTCFCMKKKEISLKVTHHTLQHRKIIFRCCKGLWVTFNCGILRTTRRTRIYMTIKIINCVSLSKEQCKGKDGGKGCSPRMESPPPEWHSIFMRQGIPISTCTCSLEKLGGEDPKLWPPVRFTNTSNFHP